MKNLVLVTVDCLRADHLGCYGYARPTSPYLDRLAAESQVVETAVVAGTPTFYSFPAILASRSPLAQGRRSVGLAPGEPTLAECLRRAGFATSAHLAGNPYLSRRDGYDQGFEDFEDFLSPRDPRFAGESAPPPAAPRAGGHPLAALYEELRFRYWYRGSRNRHREMAALRRYPAAHEVVAHALAHLQERGSSPFFLWIHLMDPHHPYHPPEEALELLGRGDLTVSRALYLNAFWNRRHVSRRRLERLLPDVVALYDAGIRWVDEQLAVLARELGKLGLWHDTVLAVTGDHGEELLEHGGRYHDPVNLHREVTRVPLLVRVPDQPARRVPGVFGLVDLAPTLLHVLGIDAPETFAGRSRWRGDAFADLREDLAVTECVGGRTHPWSATTDAPRLASVQSRRHQLIVDFASGSDRLFDLERDPRGRAPLAEGEARDIRAKLLRHLLEHLRNLRPPSRDPAYLSRRIGEVRQRVTRRSPG